MNFSALSLYFFLRFFFKHIRKSFQWSLLNYYCYFTQCELQWSKVLNQAIEIEEWIAFVWWEFFHFPRGRERRSHFFPFHLIVSSYIIRVVKRNFASDFQFGRRIIEYWDKVNFIDFAWLCLKITSPVRAALIKTMCSVTWVRKTWFHAFFISLLGVQLYSDFLNKDKANHS